MGDFKNLTGFFKKSNWVFQKCQLGYFYRLMGERLFCENGLSRKINTFSSLVVKKKFHGQFAKDYKMFG